MMFPITAMVMLAVLQNVSRCLTTAENMAYVLTITFFGEPMKSQIDDIPGRWPLCEGGPPTRTPAFKRDGAKISSDKCYYVPNWSFL